MILLSHVHINLLVRFVFPDFLHPDFIIFWIPSSDGMTGVAAFYICYFEIPRSSDHPKKIVYFKTISMLARIRYCPLLGAIPDFVLLV